MNFQTKTLFKYRRDETHNYYCSYDGQGNVAQVSNMAGDEPYSLYAYDSYGTQTGSDYSNESFSSYKGYDKGPFGYKTGVRQYDPETGRFLSPDAFKGYMTDPASQHPYMYCHGNPVKFSDPSGYSATQWLAGGAVALAICGYASGKYERKKAGNQITEIQSDILEFQGAIRQELDNRGKKGKEREVILNRVVKITNHFQKTYPTHVDPQCSKAQFHMLTELQTTFRYYGKDVIYQQKP